MPTYTITVDGSDAGRVDAEDVDSALDLAAESVDARQYGRITGAYWTDVYAYNVADRYDEAKIEVQIDELEPACVAGAHAWVQPHDIVGGCESNPGVHGHAGGVTIVSVCSECGCRRVTDTWATRPDTGKSGYTVTRHTPAVYG